MNVFRFQKLGCHKTQNCLFKQITSNKILENGHGRNTRVRSTVCISQLIRFARLCGHVTDYNERNKYLTAKFLQQGYFEKYALNFIASTMKFNVGLKTLLRDVLSDHEFMVTWYTNLRNLLEGMIFLFRKKIIIRHKSIGYNLNVMR